MRLVAKAFGLVLVLLLGGCLVETEATLAEPDPAAKDDRLVGAWYSASPGEVTLFVVTADESGNGTYRVTYSSTRTGSEKPVEYEQYRAWRTVLNGQSYLNVVRTGGTGTSAKTTLVAYDIAADGTLVLRLMDTKFVAAAIDAGKLKGTVKKNQYSDDVRVTATRAELAAFVAAAKRDELFSAKTGSLQKMTETKQ